ncbi:MAG: type II secretion system F family protein [Candidatus Moranbacteria bacterium]|nr:type II secretion system F family protein [Candidatus Moranbacteria bacterium]
MKVQYTAKSLSGEEKKGELNVKDERDLASQLRAEGFMLTSFKEIKEGEKKNFQTSFLDRFQRISLKDKLMFTRNLGVMVASGLPISRSLNNLAIQTKNKKFAQILTKIQGEVQAGGTLANGLSKYPGVFGELFTNMIRVGEASGNLEEVLNILALQLEKDHDLISKIKGAMVYPAVIIIAMLGIGIIMMIYVVPQITSVIKEMGAELPYSTKLVIAISDGLKNHLILVLSGFVAFIIILRLLLATEQGKKLIGLSAISLPLINKIVIKVNCARFSRVYSSLLKSGVPVAEALKIVSNTLTNLYYKKAFQRAAESIQKGTPLSKVLYEEKKIFPVLVPQMLEVGEETGKTEQIMLKLSEFYEEEVEQITKNLSSIIEPVLMIIIGGAVGFFAVSMMQPMYGAMQNIK